jgi:hypothetical protein
MLVYKKGSKGKPVENLQKELNRLKAKPPLKIDGDFGPKTHKAVTTFQKRAKIKVDGVVGPVTTAAIEYGGPLPELQNSRITVKEAKAAVVRLKKLQEYHLKVAALLKSLDTATNALDALLNTQVATADTMIKANKPHWDQVFKMNDTCIAVMTEFPTLRIADPHKAAKEVKRFEQMQTTYLATLDKMFTNWSKLYGTIDETIATIGDSVKTLGKQQQALKKQNAASV